MKRRGVARVVLGGALVPMPVLASPTAMACADRPVRPRPGTPPRGRRALLSRRGPGVKWTLSHPLGLRSRNPQGQPYRNHYIGCSAPPQVSRPDFGNSQLDGTQTSVTTQVSLKVALLGSGEAGAGLRRLAA